MDYLIFVAKGLLTGIVMVILFFTLIYLIYKVYRFFNKRTLKKIQRRNALLSFELLKSTYSYLLLCRKKYQEAYFIEDSKERELVRAKLKKEYDESLNILSNPKYLNYIQFLDIDKKKELRELLSQPHYSLK